MGWVYWILALWLGFNLLFVLLMDRGAYRRGIHGEEEIALGLEKGSEKVSQLDAYKKTRDAQKKTQENKAPDSQQPYVAGTGESWSRGAYRVLVDRPEHRD